MARAGRKKAQSPIQLAGRIKQPLVASMPMIVVEKGLSDGSTREVERMPAIPVAAMVQAGLSPVSNRLTRALGVVASEAVNRDGMVRSHTAPLQWLASRNMLDDNRERNGLLREAGERYYRHWFDGGLKGIGAQNLDRVFGGQADPAYMIPTTEYAAQHRHEFRAARERMGSWLAKVADAVICEEMTLADAGACVGNYARPDTRSAIALTMLKAGLTTLGDHFGILNVRPRKIRAWSD